MPVTDFGAFVGNFADAKTENGITSFTPPGSGPVYATHWGEFAAVTETKDLLTTPPAGLVIKGPVADEVATKDIVCYANMSVLSPVALKAIRAVPASSLCPWSCNSSRCDGGQPAMYKWVLEGEISGVEGLLRDARAASFGLALSKKRGGGDGDGDRLRPGDGSGSAGRGRRRTGTGRLLSGLPDQPYMILWGAAYDGKAVSTFVDKAVKPMLDAIAKDGGDAKRRDGCDRCDENLTGEHQIHGDGMA